MSSRAVRSRKTCSRTASRRSQSTMGRGTSGRGSRRRSARGGKRPARPAASARLLALVELLPHQETVRQHHQHTVPVKAGPQPALILVPAQQFLGFLVKPLHPVPTMRVLHHAHQRRVPPEVAPVVAALAVAGVFPNQPADPPLAVRGNAPAAQPPHLCPPPTRAA